MSLSCAEYGSAERRFRALVERAPDAILLLDPLGVVHYASPSVGRLLGLESANLLGTSLFERVHPDAVPELWLKFGRLVQGSGECQAEARVQHANGTWRLFEATVANLLADPDVAAVVVNARDVTDRTLAEEALRLRSLYDRVTRLPNRVLLMERLDAAIAATATAGAPLALAVFNLDRFREVNDALGRRGGDRLLRAVADRYSGVGPADTVAHLGGDEFGVLLPSADLASAERTVLDLLHALEAAVEIDGFLLDGSASAGLAAFPAHATDADTLLRRAEAAMSAAKRAGSRLAVYVPEHEEGRTRRLGLAGELRRAIDGDGLRLVYQPKVSLRSGRLAGVEALARWDHPERGPIPPTEFIPLAEQTGLIGLLTRWLLDRALAQWQAWCAQGLDVPMAINLSARDLADPRLPATVAEALVRYAAPPERLTVEVTEGAMLTDAARAVRTLSELRALGVRVALDDFGTGYSSLGYLKRLPVDELKVDRAFVAGMATDESDAAIVRAAAGLGHQFGLLVVAEGVEDAETLGQLAGSGCDAAQGFHLARPLPPDDVARWARESRWGVGAAS